MKLIPLDYTLTKIFEQIKKELKEEGIEVSTNQIHRIVDTQSKCIARGIANGDLVYAPKLGSFKIMKKIEIKYNLQRNDRFNPMNKLMSELDERGLGVKIKFKTKDEIIRGVKWGASPSEGGAI